MSDDVCGIILLFMVSQFAFRGGFGALTEHRLHDMCLPCQAEGGPGADGPWYCGPAGTPQEPGARRYHAGCCLHR